ncbi:2Fe-2S iron-sulfur cluster binding domain protein [Aspergillus campestris IBT 28561]|uniref:2Fe-2S iron-sulfur cluster binding domain protein n=1 Tax=Aspergillus campestris (strain IBT 28561) TaxID=1392248 RepID=A0A2I1D215_ASPC2|nr:2Fe-2S iron-sulfur cluster binding domain protein [Aspergillus campestris IBT 28561]PKY03932.1 2Fe-2S iron-sulfur cluster binding domain protein [Aspergillus campestris IBT 28561]
MFWKEAGRGLRHAVPKSVSGKGICRIDSQRFLSSSAQKSRIVNSTTSPLTLTRSNVVARGRGQWQRLESARRSFSATAGVQHGHVTPPKAGEEINVTFIDKDNEKYEFQVAEGDNLLDIAQANDLEMEGACGGSCACSTCHVIVEDPDMFDKMEEPSDDENDMLDLAFGLTETSRLGCQVVMNKDLDGLVVRLPSMTRNMQASDFAPKT